MFERFSNQGRMVLVSAQDEARLLGHPFIGTEHIALGVVMSADPAVTQVLAGYDFTLDDMRSQIAELIGPSDEDVAGPVPFTPRAKKVLELSLREALALGHDHIGPAHMLLGIMREGEGVGAKVLADFGLEYDRVRLWVAQALGDGPMSRRRGRGRGRMRRRDFERGLAGGFPPGMTPGLTSALFQSRTLAGDAAYGTQHMLLALLDEEQGLAAKVLGALGVTREAAAAKIEELGTDGTSDAPPAPPVEPRTVTLSEGVEIRITDPKLAAMAESGELEELVREIVRRAKPDA